MRIVSFISLFFLVACGQCFKNRNGGSEDNNRGIISSDIASENSQLSDKSSLISCDGIGIIKLSDSMADLKHKVGQANITQDSLFLEGSFQGFVTKLWKNTSKEITLYWIENEAPYKTIRGLEVTNPESPYHFANGIRVGTTMKQLEELNGSIPISFTGFEIDYPLAGRIIGFNEGKLALDLPCFGGSFNYESKIPISTVGDSIFRSDNPGLKEVTCKLISIDIMTNRQ